MEKLSVPKRLRSRVMDYYSYLWDRHGTFDVRSNWNLSAELSKCLNSEISLFFHRKMVSRVPIFRHSSPRVVRSDSIEVRNPIEQICSNHARSPAPTRAWQLATKLAARAAHAWQLTIARRCA